MSNVAILSCKERHQDRKSSWKDGKLTHSRAWIVHLDKADGGTAEAITAVPSPGTTYRGSVLMDLDADPLDASDVWFIIKGSYEGVEFGFPPNPVDFPPTVAYNFNEYSEPYFSDCTTPTPKRVVNTASDPFEQFLERDNADLTIQIETNEEGFPVLTIDALKYTVNQNPVHIDGVTYAPKTLRLNPPTGQRVKEKVEGEGGTIAMRTYYKCTWVVKAKHDGWNDKVLDVGYNELVKDIASPTVPGRILPIVNAANVKIDKPWPLHQGRKKPKPDDVPDELEFVPYKSAIWPWRWTTEAGWVDS